MATVRQTVQLDETEADELKAALGGRVVDPVLSELRAVLNAPAQPADDDGGRQTVVTKLRAGHEVTDDLVHTLTEAVAQRTRLLQTLVELLGPAGVHAAEVLQSHARAESVLRAVTSQLTTDGETPERSHAGSLS